MNKVILKGRLDGKQRNLLKGLYDMSYKPSELAEELQVNLNQIYRVYLPLGCPRERDVFRHITINGEQFRKWYLENYKKATLKENESFCKTCQKPVNIVNGTTLKKKRMIYIISDCPECGRKLSKIIECSNKHDKPQ
jgi:hypothetical protein